MEKNDAISDKMLYKQYDEFLHLNQKVLDKCEKSMYNRHISTERTVNSVKNTIFITSRNRITLSMEFACTAV